ncbi:MAG: helix-turn-helix transcriptional regulator [Bacteroidaceae bacterium]|nr:helix-turn-helix transcriptional regulator [Bacteroidaceae bacterium]
MSNEPTNKLISHRSEKIDLLEFMNANYRRDMSMTEFAKASGRSLSTFKRDFKKISELSPERWLTNHRLHAAYDLLKRGYHVSDACFEVGFKNVSHFSAIFKRKFGMTAGQVRKLKDKE